MVLSSDDDMTFQMRMVPSSDPDAKSFPSGEKAIFDNSSPVPNVWRREHVSVSRSSIFPLRGGGTNTFKFGEKHADPLLHSKCGMQETFFVSVQVFVSQISLLEL
jgi:hypothetical protein